MNTENNTPEENGDKKVEKKRIRKKIYKFFGCSKEGQKWYFPRLKRAYSRYVRVYRKEDKEMGKKHKPVIWSKHKMF